MNLIEDNGIAIHVLLVEDSPGDVRRTHPTRNCWKEKRRTAASAFGRYRRSRPTPEDGVPLIASDCRSQMARRKIPKAMRKKSHTASAQISLAANTPISLGIGKESVTSKPSKKFPYVPAAAGETRVSAK
jgi:hypothetical protein